MSRGSTTKVQVLACYFPFFYYYYFICQCLRPYALWPWPQSRPMSAKPLGYMRGCRVVMSMPPRSSRADQTTHWFQSKFTVVFFFLSGHVCTQLYGLYCLGGRASIAIGTWLKMQFPSCFCYSSPRHTGRFRRWYLVYKGKKRSFDIHGLYIFDCNLGLPSADSVTSHLPHLFNVMLATRTLGGSYHCYYFTLFYCCSCLRFCVARS